MLNAFTNLLSIMIDHQRDSLALGGGGREAALRHMQVDALIRMWYDRCRLSRLHDAAEKRHDF